MGKLVFYYHGGSKNHGCEAIVRSTRKILNRDAVLFTSEKAEDYEYNLDKIVEIKDDVTKSLSKKSIDYLVAAISHKIRKNDYKFVTLTHKDFFNNIDKGDICLSIGGDNYCYKGRDILGYYNKKLHKLGAKTVLWGCSVGEDDITPDVKEDLALYDLIITREKISYDALIKVNKSTVLLPDPAFQLDRELLPLPTSFIEGNTIGINLSPLVSEYGNGNVILDNYRNLIKYILKETDSNIALIPHVVKNGNDDRTVLKVLYDEYESSGRIVFIEDCNCMQLKGFISRCKIFIGARTHATIAAYSTNVPTLVLGYSIKSIGIAREIFGTDENYVVPVQNLKNDMDLTNAFVWILEHEPEIKNRLNEFMPEYKDRILNAKDLVNNL